MSGDGCDHYVCLAGICQTAFCTEPSSGASSGAPSGEAECAAPGDCEKLLGPLPSFCIANCPNGGEGCEHYLCLSGLCQTSYCN
jgi:hypothetical protein